MRDLTLAWKMRQVPGGATLDTMDWTTARKLTLLIQLTEEGDRFQDFKNLARLLGAEEKPKRATDILLPPGFEK